MLKKYYEGNEKIKLMQVFIQEFYMQRMKELEVIKDYAYKLLTLVNKVILLGSDFPDSRIVQK